MVHVLIPSSSDLINITSIRRRYKKNMMVLFELTAVDVTNSSGFFPAYFLNAPLAWNAYMSCSYVRGQGALLTSVLVNYGNISRVREAIKISNANHLIVADLTIDRTNSSWWTPGYECSMANTYPKLIPNNQASVVLSTQECKQFFSRTTSMVYQPMFQVATYAIQVVLLQFS